ncbi:hypothetical protein L345_02139, partial [Ophiophagus hannah]
MGFCGYPHKHVQVILDPVQWYNIKELWDHHLDNRKIFGYLSLGYTTSSRQFQKTKFWNKEHIVVSISKVADTPENIRLKQQSELQSQVKYKRDFEESKGRGFSIVTDTPELQRLKRTQEQISNVELHY